MSWSPELADSTSPAYRRLADALAADVRGGRLEPGVRLPPHRDLAHRLGISVATVTRAYAEAEAAGLITSQVGRGSFVAEAAAAPASTGPIDLARNLPPPGPAERRIGQAFAAVSRRPDLAGHLGYPPPGGSPLLRQALVRWLAETANFPGLQASRLMLTAGSQQAVAAALGAVMRPGEALLAEEASFAGIKTMAGHMDYRLLPGAMDDEGLTPEALERGAAQGAKAAYVLPVQNPTARVLGEKRRQDLVDVARRRAIWLVEDDLYGPYARDLSLAPLAALAPERVLYVGGLSKTLAPGLRLGFLATPPGGVHESALEALRAIAFSPPGLGALVALQWLSDGTGEAILAEVLAEASARTLRARQVLGRHVAASPLSASPHIWLPMEGELAAEQVAGRALRRGVAVTPPRAPMLEGVPVQGLRLCLGAPRDMAELERGLQAVARALADEPEGRDAV